MLGIIFFHFGPAFISFIMDLCGLWGVDLFLFLSGFGCAYALKKYNTDRFFIKRFNRLIPTCIFIGLIVFLLDNIFHIEYLQEYPLIRLLSLHRWYIQVAILCYLLSPIFYKLLIQYGAKSLIVCLLFVVLSFAFPQTNKVQLGFIRFDLLIPRIPAFIIGMYVAIYDLKMDKKKFIISSLFLIAATTFRLYIGVPICYWAYFLSVALPLICLILAKFSELLRRNKFTKTISLIEFMGLYSLEIYLIHEYLFYCLNIFKISSLFKYIIFISILFPSAYITKKCLMWINSFICSCKKYICATNNFSQNKQ